MRKFVLAAIVVAVCVFGVGCGEESPLPASAVSAPKSAGVIPSGLYTREDAIEV